MLFAPEHYLRSLEGTLIIGLLLGSLLLVNPFLTTDVFEFPKLLVLYVGTGALTLVNIIDLSCSNLSSKELRNHVLKLGFLSLFLFAQVLAFVFSTDRAISLMGAPDRFQGFVTQVHYVLLALNVWYYFSCYPSESQNIFRWFPVILLLLCSLAILPYLFPLTFPFTLFTPAFFADRVYGTLGNPNYLAASIITLLPFLFMCHPERSRRVVTRCVILTLSLLTLLLTGSRSAWAASLAGFFVLGILEFFRDRKLWKLLIASSILVTVLALGSFKSFLVPEGKLLERLRLDTPTSTSLQTRLSLWGAGLQLARERPFTGLGQDMVKGNIEPYLPSYLKENEVFFIDRTHSELIDVLTTTGVLGFLGYFGFFSLVLWNGVRTLFHKKHTGTFLVSSVLALFTLFLFHAVNFSTISSNVLLYFLVGSLLSLSSSPLGRGYRRGGRGLL